MSVFRNEPFGEQFFIDEGIRRLDIILAKFPVALLILYTDEELDAEFLQSFPTHRPQMPPKKVREKTIIELAIEYDAWAERKAIQPGVKKPRKQKASGTLLRNRYDVEQIVGFRVTPTGFKYIVKWKGYSKVQNY